MWKHFILTAIATLFLGACDSEKLDVEENSFLTANPANYSLEYKMFEAQVENLFEERELAMTASDYSCTKTRLILPDFGFLKEDEKTLVGYITCREKGWFFNNEIVFDIFEERTGLFNNVRSWKQPLTET